ncbi:MAG: glycosyltransferase family 4 protein [Sedimentisphaerales bacterium]|nr:glycosyltransferase family 4 protein [Sedimentisphaerales bacterium]
MKIVQITPGSGDNFYCENCLRDAALVTAMYRLEHEITLLPMYLPLQISDKEIPRKAPIFFGGINVYLQQKLSIFRKTPRWLDKLFDRPGLLEWASRKAGMTSAKDLAQTTISMLQGRHGRQIKELDRLIEWLARDENKPEIVILSNILLIGLAKPIAERLRAKVVCLLQDEDGFLDGLMPPYTQQAWDLVKGHSRDVDLFISVSKYYAELMRQKLGLDPERLKVVHVGISPEGYRLRENAPEVPTIGYLSRMCPERGLDTLIDAFIRIKENESLKNTRLRIAGGKSAADESFIDKMRQKLNSHGLSDDVEFLPDFERSARLDFLHSLSVLSVPEKKPVAYGLYVLEAFASGVPVVEPDIGVFPELIEMTGGGLLYQDNTAAGLAAAIEPLLLDSDYALELGKKGRDAVVEKLGIRQSAEEMIRILKQIM